jgi:hypothetical protein
MTDNQSPVARREVTQSRIEIFDLAGGGKEFVSPAMRNFREKMPFTIMLLVFAAVFAGFIFFVMDFVGGLPFAWARFIAVNFLFSFFAILGLLVLLLGIVCSDLWLRSSRVIAVTGELRVVTRWLFFRQTNVIPVSKIIETKAANNTTVNDTYYYDIMVLTEGNGQNWWAALFYPDGKPKMPGNSFTANDLKVLNSGGKKIRAITNIIGQTEADSILREMNQALGRE